VRQQMSLMTCFIMAQFTDRVRGQFHIELLNAFDQPFFNSRTQPNSATSGR
jgi:hypothetical protein